MGKNIINFDYSPDQEPPNIIEMLKHFQQTLIDFAKDEEEKMKSPDWEYKRIHFASKEIYEKMTSPDTPLEIRRQLEWATFIGYEWVHKGEDNIFIDEKI